MLTISATNITGHQGTCNLDIIPDYCPVCHRGIQPVLPDWNHIGQDGELLEMVFICPLRSCNHVFIGRYYRNTSSGYYFLKQCLPVEPRELSQPPELKKISPDFCAIYHEAHKAEKFGLSLISGPGYRKALEFLIKDYLASLQTTPEARKNIAEWSLMAVIKKYVTDKRMLTTAERAAWLGNDETHYIRKWEEKDLQDLKKLIELTCFWIQSEHLTGEAAIDMPEGKK